jgi:GntR family transcriptional regulator
MRFGDVLDRDSALPLWAQILTHLRQRIAAGEFGEKFPTDHELVDEYGVSRHTIREAVRRIQEAGILDRRRGRGTFITAGFEQPLGSIYSLFRSIEASGVEQTSVVMSQAVRVDDHVADRLGLTAGTEFFYLERLRLADDEVLAIDRTWVPLSIARPLLDADFSKTALYNELRDRCGVSPETGSETIRAVIPSPPERDELGIDTDTAAFLIERVTMANGEPLEWRETMVRGDDYRFVTHWTPDRPSDTALSVDLAEE